VLAPGETVPVGPRASVTPTAEPARPEAPRARPPSARVRAAAASLTDPAGRCPSASQVSRPGHLHRPRRDWLAGRPEPQGGRSPSAPCSQTANPFQSTSRPYAGRRARGRCLDSRVRVPSTRVAASPAGDPVGGQGGDVLLSAGTAATRPPIPASRLPSSGYAPGLPETVVVTRGTSGRGRQLVRPTRGTSASTRCQSRVRSRREDAARLRAP